MSNINKERRMNKDRRKSEDNCISCTTGTNRDTDPISRHDHYNTISLLNSRLDSHDIILNDTLEMVHKNTNCMKEVKTKQDIMAELVIPVATGVKSIEQTLEFLRPLANFGKWFIIATGTIGAGYISIHAAIEQMFHK